MKNIFKTIWFALAATTFVACNNPTPDPEPEPPAPTAIAFSALTANGSATQTTTVITLTFDKVIDGLAAQDITITAGETGTTKGALTAKGSGVYELAVSGIVKGGQITVAVAKAKFTIAPASKTVTVNYLAAPAIKDNSIAFGDEAPLEFKSIVFDETLDVNRIFAAASPIEGLTTYKEILKQNDKGEYINKPLMLNIYYKDMNQTFDVMTERVAVYGMSNDTGVGAEVASFMPGMYPSITAGKFWSTYDKETGDLSISFSVTAKASGKLLQANITGNFKPAPAPEGNIMMFNDDVSVIKSKYYKKENGGVTFYVSPIETSATDLLTEGHYAKFWISDEAIASGEPIEMMEEGVGEYEFNYKNVLHYENIMTIKPDNLNGAMGMITVMEISEGEYAIEYEVSFSDGNTVTGTADGAFTAF